MLHSEIIGPSGSGGPFETGHVICPACAHNFPAIPQNAQERIAELEAVLREIADHPTGGVGCNPQTFVEMARKALNG